MEKTIKCEKLTLGVCYYPEHWPESMWENDLDHMLELSISVVRVFEFAWTIIEPSEGEFTFAFFDRFLELAERKGMRVILCTPTATPPVWLSEKYPEILNADIYGHLIHNGHRRHYTYNSPQYNRLCARVTEMLAKQYGTHPAVIGWQIDNEINCETDVFYSDCDHTAFRKYLVERFGTLKAFNDAIGAVFWNQTYTDWDEVYLTRKTIAGKANPHLELLEKQFISNSAIAFVKKQADILRHHCKNQFITTNGVFGHLDSHELTETALDFITYDSYPNFAYSADGGGGGELKDRAWAIHLSKTRSISANFGVMEQQSGAGGWDFAMLQCAPRPGQMRLWTYQSIAHGADFISYFRWRTCGFGTEMYWHGINDPSNVPNRRVKELQQIGCEIKNLCELAGTKNIAKVAVLCDYLNEWDGERDKWYGPLARASTYNWVLAAQYSHTPLDFVYLNSDLTAEQLLRYELLIYPHASIMTRETADLLETYCENGGRLVLGARTGYKDERGFYQTIPMPGFAAKLGGVSITDYTIVASYEPSVSINWNGRVLPAPSFNEILSAENGGIVFGTYDGGYYEGKPGLVCREYSHGGAAYYFGGGFAKETATAFLEDTGVIHPYDKLLELPECAELEVRAKAGVEYFFIMNFSSSDVSIKLHTAFFDLIRACNLEGEVLLNGYDVLVLRKASSDKN